MYSTVRVIEPEMRVNCDKMSGPQRRISSKQSFLVYCLSEHFCRAGNISLFPLPPPLSPASSFFRPIAFSGPTCRLILPKMTPCGDVTEFALTYSLQGQDLNWPWVPACLLGDLLGAGAWNKWRWRCAVRTERSYWTNTVKERTLRRRARSSEGSITKLLTGWSGADCKEVACIGMLYNCYMCDFHFSQVMSLPGKAIFLNGQHLVNQSRIFW